MKDIAPILPNDEQTVINQTEINGWDYNRSVASLKGKVANYKKLNLEIVRELFIAHRWFGIHGNNRFTEKGKTFMAYVEEIGLNRMTAHRWINRYLPQEDRLLEIEEVKAIERNEKKEKDIRIAGLVAEYRHTSIYPEGWDDDCQRLYDQLHQGQTILPDPDEFAKQQQSYAHIFESKMQRKGGASWNQKEVAAWARVEEEPIRSLAKQIEREHVKRTTVAEVLFEIEKVVAKYPDDEAANARIELRNLQRILGEIK